MPVKTIYSCEKCGAQFLKWSGRCLECGAWGTVKEETSISQPKDKEAAKKVSGTKAVDLSSISLEQFKRLPTGIGEMDRVLGGGLVPGSLILLGGEPGIGKSTLASQIIDAVSRQLPALYVSGEESAAQVKLRLERLGCELSRWQFVGESNLEKLSATLEDMKPGLLVVDSIQTIYSALLPSEAGSVSQIRAAAVRLLEIAKRAGMAVIIIGHITKDGQIAGPKSLEHIVDTVLSLEVDAATGYALLRSSKNRFGSASELGIFEMTGTGFRQVADAGAAFFNTKSLSFPGVAASCVFEGTRPFFVDIQALATKTVFGYPQRKSSGVDLNRLQVLCAVIAKRTKANVISQDIILNVVGGLRVSDPALDLAVCAAIISSYYNQPFPRQSVFFGEVGLGGEVRPVAKLEQRLAEAIKLGFTEALIPDGPTKAGGIKLRKIKGLNELVEMMGHGIDISKKK